MKPKYITKQQLRQLGLKQYDSEILPFLERVNRSVAAAIDQEIYAEIKQNYDDNMLQEYTDLRRQHAFESPLVQDWLRQNIAALDEITTDHIEMMLSKMRIFLAK